MCIYTQRDDSKLSPTHRSFLEEYVVAPCTLKYIFGILIKGKLRLAVKIIWCEKSGTVKTAPTYPGGAPEPYTFELKIEIQ